FLGVNYYQPMRVKAPQYQWNPESPFLPAYYYEPYDMPGKKMNPYRGWEIYEKGIYDLAMMIKDEYDNIDWCLTENGKSMKVEQQYRKDGMIQDDYRIEYMQ